MNADEATELLAYVAFVVATVDRDTLATPGLLAQNPVMTARWRLFVQRFDAYRAQMQAQLNKKRGYQSPFGTVLSQDASQEAADIEKMLSQVQQWEAAWRDKGAAIADTSRKEVPGRLAQVLGDDAATAIKGGLLIAGIAVAAYALSSVASLAKALRD